MISNEPLVESFSLDYFIALTGSDPDENPAKEFKCLLKGFIREICTRPQNYSIRSIKYLGRDRRSAVFQVCFTNGRIAKMVYRWRDEADCGNQNVTRVEFRGREEFWAAKLYDCISGFFASSLAEH